VPVCVCDAGKPRATLTFWSADLVLSTKTVSLDDDLRTDLTRLQAQTHWEVAQRESPRSNAERRDVRPRRSHHTIPRRLNEMA